MRLSESLKEKYNSTYQKALLEKWSKNIGAAREVYPKMSDISAINLAIVCENTEAAINKYRRLSEGTQAADVGAYIRHAFELITAIMPNLVIEDVVSVQALTQKIGQIFFLKYVYGSNKGTVEKGDLAFGPYDIANNPNYTSEDIDQEIISADGGSATISAVLAYGPVIPGTVVVDVDGTKYHDNGAGAFVASGALTSGTINYTSGAITLNFAQAPGTQIDASYQYSLEYAPTQAPQLNMNIEEVIVTAKPRRLRTNYAFAAAYDVEKQFGINMDDELLDASISEIRHEIDQEILGDLLRQAGLTHTWDMTRPTGVSKMQHYESWGIALNEGCNLIRKATKRAKGNIVVCGLNALNATESLPGYVPANAEDKVGAYVAGTIKGNIKVIANPFYGDDEYLIAYKGANFLDAGYVYAPYMPVFATQVVMLDDFVGRRGYATSYAKRMLNPTYYVRGTITHSQEGLSVFNTEENPIYTKEVTNQ